MLRRGDLVDARFEVEEEVASGGMSTLFRAHDRKRGAPVALKLLAGGGERVARFDREARALSSLEHPGIVRYVAHGTVAGSAHYLAMEWLDGEDLAARLKRGRLSVWETSLLGARVADALAMVHSL